MASLAAGCDLNRAYDPNHPCSSLMRVASAPAPVQRLWFHKPEQGGATSALRTIPTIPAARPDRQQRRAAGFRGANRSRGLRPQCCAYDPNHPCTSSASDKRIGLAGWQPQQVMVRQAAIDGCDPNIAYDPDRPCQRASAASPAVSPPMDRPAGIRGDSSRLLSNRRRRSHLPRRAANNPAAGNPRPRLGDPGRRLREPWSCARRGGGRPRPGAGPAPLRCPGVAADPLWRLGSLSRAPGPLVGERRVRRLLAAEPAPTPLRRRPAESLLILERPWQASRAAAFIRLVRARADGGIGCARRRRTAGSPSTAPRPRPAPTAAGLRR